MAISTAAKVGIATFVGLLVTAAGASWLTNFSLRPAGYEFKLLYNDVSGLMEGAPVRLMGVRVGSVKSVVPEERMVRVTVHVLDDDVKIVDRSRFMIMSQGIIGEKLLEIFPPEKVLPEPDYVEPGEVLRGDDPARVELVMEEITEAFRQFRDAVDPNQLAQIFTQTAENLRDTTTAVNRMGGQAEALLNDFSRTLARVDKLVADTDRLVVSADPVAVRETVADLRELSGSLLATYEGFFGSTQSRTENAETIRSVRSILTQLDRLAKALGSTAGDPEVQQDTRTILKNIRELTQRVSQATAIAESDRVAGLGFSPRLDGTVANIGGRTGLAGNLQLRVNMPSNYFQSGIEQLGEGNFFNLYFGDEGTWGPLGYHAGLIRSKLGAGLDYDFTDRVQLNSELFDPFRPTLRLGGTYLIGPTRQYGLMAQWARELPTDLNIFWLGLQWRPLDNQPAVPVVPVAPATPAP